MPVLLNRSVGVAVQHVSGVKRWTAGTPASSVPAHSSSTTGYSSWLEVPEFGSGRIPPVGGAPDHVTSIIWWLRSLVVLSTETEKVFCSTTSTFPSTRWVREICFEPVNSGARSVRTDAATRPEARKLGPATTTST